MHECLPGLCYSSHPVARVRRKGVCVTYGSWNQLHLPRTQGIPGQFPRVHASGQQVGRRLSREHGPPPSLRSLLESLTLPLGGEELERQGWGQGQRQSCFGENGSSEIPKGPEDHLLSFCQIVKRCSQLAPLGASSYPGECPAEAQTGWLAGWCLTGKNF